MEPLKAYDAEGQIIALSYDGGKNWGQAQKRGEKKPKMREYAHRIAAITPEEGLTPSWERRIASSFSPLSDANILAGWGRMADILELDDNALDAIVLPYGVVEGDPDTYLAELRRVAPKILLDLEASQITNRQGFQELATLARQVDAVLVPSDLVGMSLRKFNPHTFTVPPSINANVWVGAKRAPREPGDKLRLAFQHTNDRHIMDAVQWAKNRWERLELVEDNWQDRSPRDEPEFYTDIDVLVVGPPEQRVHLNNANIIGAMMAGCCIVAEASYNRTILHGHSGILVAQKGPSPWRKELTHAITDGKTRIKMQKGARERARFFLARGQINRLAMPYRVLLR